MAYQYSLTTIIPAPAREIYDAWLDSVAHSKMTGGQAKTSAELGAEFMAWDGYITGRNLELRPGERIVQAWRTTKFPEDHEDSIVTVTLEERDEGTLLTLSHSNVPDGHLGYEQGGWQKSYFEPMIAFFSDEPAESDKAGQDLQSEPEAQPEERAPQRAARKPAPRARAKRSAARKPAAAPKALPRSVPAKNKKRAAAPKAQPKRGAAQKKPVAKKKAPVQKVRRKMVTTKAKPKAKATRARSRAKPRGRAKARARPVRATRRGSAGRRRR